MRRFNSLVVVLFCLPFLLNSSALFAQTFEVQFNETSSENSEGWYRNRRRVETDGFAKRPAAILPNQFLIHWENPKLDKLGNDCTLSGKLLYTDPATNEKQLVNWLQGVTVLLAKSPQTTPDWSKGMDQTNTVFETTTISKQGEFAVEIETREFNFSRKNAESFQVGIALAMHSPSGRMLGKTVESISWKSQLPALPASIKLLTIPAATKISIELELINNARNWAFTDPNSVHLIRAVNALQRLEKDEALQILEEYAETPGGWKGHDIVFWIIRILFEPIDLDQRIPSPMIYLHFSHSQKQAANWPLDPLVIVDDIPFMLGQKSGGSGQPESPFSHIEWARRYGVIRDQPLKPSGNPLVAAEKLLQSERFQQLPKFNWDDKGLTVQNQSIATLENQVGPTISTYEDEESQHELWKKLLNDSKQLNLHWDSELQTFTTEQVKPKR